MDDDLRFMFLTIISASSSDVANFIPPHCSHLNDLSAEELARPGGFDIIEASSIIKINWKVLHELHLLAMIKESNCKIRNYLLFYLVLISSSLHN